MRRPTLLELVLCCCIVAVLASLLLPSRQPQVQKPGTDVILRVVMVLSTVLAATGATTFITYQGGRWLRSRLRGSGGVAPVDQ
jgi:hypothetical protein